MTASPAGILKTIGELSVDEFMRRHWQRAPLLARAALPDFKSPLSPDALLDMASQDEVQARLITQQGERWTLAHGPIDRLPSRRRGGWTVLVNGIDRHLDAAHDLLRRFRFLPDARLDDLMASYATDGGGVGPHADSYDVFLLQAHGRRRWRVAPPGDGALVAGAPIKLLARFEPTQEWVLEPGDMLYVPPGWGHEGTAMGECVTLSIGFRAPSRHEFLSAFLAASADSLSGPDTRFSDRGRMPARQPGALPRDLAAQLHDWASGWKPSRSEIDRFIGCYLTEPAPDVWFEPPATMRSAAQFAAQVKKQGVVLDRRTRMAWRGPRVFINGEACEVLPNIRAALRALADDRSLPATHRVSAQPRPALIAQLHEWARHGWLHAGPATRSQGR